ncbi:MAG: mandelate racemase/muconate lactonizing enzyme family protein [Candidatus Methylomirabilia bacterium]
MKITSIEVGIVTVPLRSEFATAHGSVSVQRSALARVRTDEGYVGWGNVDPTPGYSEMSVARVVSTVTESLVSALLGSDPMNIAAAMRRMDAQCPAGNEAKALVEMALLDLKGKALGVPVWSLLGGKVRDEVAFNAWIGTVPPQQAAADAAEWCRRGFRSAKIKVGGKFREDLDRVAATRAAVGDKMRLRVDANEGLDVEGAIRLARALAPYQISLFEQPVARTELHGLARIRRESPIPIMADESVRDARSVIEIIRLEAADLIKVKVMKQGGMLRTLQLASIAEAAGLGVILGHGFGLWTSTLAEVHVAAANLSILDGCEAVGPLKMAGEVVKHPPDMGHGSIAVPDAPGLGVEPEEGLLARYGWDGSMTERRGGRS